MECDPEGTIQGGDPRSGSRLHVGGELLAKGKFEDRLLHTISKERQHAAKQ